MRVLLPLLLVAMLAAVGYAKPHRKQYQPKECQDVLNALQEIKKKRQYDDNDETKYLNCERLRPYFADLERIQDGCSYTVALEVTDICQDEWENFDTTSTSTTDYPPTYSTTTSGWVWPWWFSSTSTLPPTYSSTTSGWGWWWWSPSTSTLPPTYSTPTGGWGPQWRTHDGSPMPPPSSPGPDGGWGHPWGSHDNSPMPPPSTPPTDGGWGFPWGSHDNSPMPPPSTPPTDEGWGWGFPWGSDEGQPAYNKK